MTAPPLGEHFWSTLLAPVEAPSTGEAVAPSPVEPAVEPAPSSRTPGTSLTELRRSWQRGY
eukprot:4447340-Alexandrium_andersonii.AAC.1